MPMFATSSCAGMILRPCEREIPRYFQAMVCWGAHRERPLVSVGDMFPNKFEPLNHTEISDCVTMMAHIPGFPMRVSECVCYSRPCLGAHFGTVKIVGTSWKHIEHISQKMHLFSDDLYFSTLTQPVFNLCFWLEIGLFTDSKFSSRFGGRWQLDADGSRCNLNTRNCRGYYIGSIA